jgi:GTP-binding protein
MRSAAFVHLIDLSVEHRDPLESFDIVSEELRKFREDLTERPVIVALNKVDVAGEERAQQVKAEFARRGIDAFIISAADGTGLYPLTKKLAQVVTEYREERSRPQGFELFKTTPDPIKVVREGNGWRVTGGSLLRWVAMTDLNNPEAVAYLQNRIDRAGVETLLGKAGAEHGDEVRIGKSVFSWWPKGSAPLEAYDVEGETKLKRGGR